jgi:hypothetical protein
VKDFPVMFTIATAGYVPFVLNLHASLTRLHLGDHFTAYALDDRAHRRLSNAGVRSIRYGEDTGHDEHEWRTVGFIKTMSYKYAVALEILEAGQSAVYLDCDIVVLRDPIDYLRTAMASAGADLALQYQSPKNTYCAGFWCATPSPAVKALMAVLVSTLRVSERVSDEETLNGLLRKGPGVVPLALDPDLFACGNRFLVSDEQRRRYPDSGGALFDRAAAYILHFTHVIGIEAKVRAMVAQHSVFHPSLARHARPGLRTFLPRLARAGLRVARSGWRALRSN